VLNPVKGLGVIDEAGEPVAEGVEGELAVCCDDPVMFLATGTMPGRHRIKSAITDFAPAMLDIGMKMVFSGLLVVRMMSLAVLATASALGN
jgi:hypothetical protein